MKRSKKMKEENFETKIQALEQIVSDLEKGDLNLDESVKKFEEGMKISKQCSKMLEETEKRITKHIVKIPRSESASIIAFFLFIFTLIPDIIIFK
jgi:exodeoxyribonuclease VII small subunit